jgi:hypothetical protein
MKKKIIFVSDNFSLGVTLFQKVASINVLPESVFQNIFKK